MDLAARTLPLLGTWTGLERLTDGAGATTSARASLVLRLDLGARPSSSTTAGSRPTAPS